MARRTPTRTSTARSRKSASRRSPAVSQGVNVGAATETEVKENKDRVEDALQATRATLEQGIVPDGGTAVGCQRHPSRQVPVQKEDEKTGA